MTTTFHPQKKPHEVDSFTISILQMKKQACKDQKNQNQTSGQ